MSLYDSISQWPRPDDDFSDRLSYYYTTTLLIIFSLLVGFKQFGGKPLECWVDASFSSGWEDYTEMYCWAQNTYFVPMSERIPGSTQDRNDRQISYYQWVPFFLLIQAFLFYTPCLIWRSLNDNSGFNIYDTVKLACHAKNLDPNERKSTIDKIARHLETVIRHQRVIASERLPLHRFFLILNLRYNEAYLTILYLVTKLFYLANIFCQLWLMNYFLHTENSGIYGVDTAMGLIRGDGWHESGSFPRVTMCDFHVRLMGNVVQKHTVQCVLVINIFNEKIFIILWFWFFVVAFFTFCSFMSWLIISIVPRQRMRFVARHLELSEDFIETTHIRHKMIQKFVRHHIKMDGVFVLRIITVHAGVLFGTELLESMWASFKQSTGERCTSVPTMGSKKEAIVNVRTGDDFSISETLPLTGSASPYIMPNGDT